MTAFIYTARHAEQSVLVRKLEPKAGQKASLVGVVDFVRIVNEQNGWGFAKLYLKKERVIVPIVGTIEELYEGADAEISGLWIEHPRFGWQVKTERILLALPSTGEGVVAWLCHRMPDVGPVRARRLVGHYPPPQLWDVMEGEPEKLEEVDGIGPQIAQQIIAAYHVWKYEREQFTALAQFGLRPEQIRAAVNAWGRNSVETVMANPYALRQLQGIGFKQADAIARKMGIKKVDPRRVFAGLAYAAEMQEREGHTCQSKKKLCSIACSADVLGLRPKFVVPLFDDAVAAGEVTELRGFFYRPAMARAESDLAARVLGLLDPEGAN